MRRDETCSSTPPVFVRERVEESVAHHLVSDVPVGVFLSAGIDSSALAQIAARQTPLHTFTLVRGSAEFSEAPLAERFARELGTTHTTRVVDARRVPAPTCRASSSGWTSRPSTA